MHEAKHTKHGQIAPVWVSLYHPLEIDSTKHELFYLTAARIAHQTRGPHHIAELGRGQQLLEALHEALNQLCGSYGEDGEEGEVLRDSCLQRRVR